MKRWTILPLAALGLPLAMQAAPAAAIERDARCVLISRGAPNWRGPCRFSSRRGGSFSVSTVPPGMDGMTDFSLDIISPGVGRASYMMSSGRHEDGGVMRRSRRDRACWVARDYSLCVY
jgi:hypothetical protein